MQMGGPSSSGQPTLCNLLSVLNAEVIAVIHYPLVVTGCARCFKQAPRLSETQTVRRHWRRRPMNDADTSLIGRDKPDTNQSRVVFSPDVTFQRGVGLSRRSCAAVTGQVIEVGREVGGPGCQTRQTGPARAEACKDFTAMSQPPGWDDLPPHAIVTSSFHPLTRRKVTVGSSTSNHRAGRASK